MSGLPTRTDTPELRRALGGVAVTVYAVGDILGAGIYALVGKVAGMAGTGAWLSMLVAAAVALFTGLSYAELASRFPLSAGAAVYCHRAFDVPVPAFVIGVLVLASGITSAATVSRAFVGYLAPFVDMHPDVASIGLLAFMSALSWWGIRESSMANLVLTAAEFSGLLLVIGVGIVYASGLPAGVVLSRIEPRADVSGVLGGATIAFFAYIGFEDTVNLAEEMREPTRTLPRAILVAIGITTAVYLAVMAAALVTVGPGMLARSGSPLLEVLDASGVRLPANGFSLVALLAVANTGLLNLIMASRVAYGMSREGLLPAGLARVDRVRRTPWVSVILVFALAALLSLTGGVAVLAQSTSLLLLMVFATVHVSLVVVKRRYPEHGGFTTPRWTPFAGLLLALGLASQSPAHAFTRAGIVLVGAMCLYWAFGRSVRSDP